VRRDLGGGPPQRAARGRVRGGGGGGDGGGVGRGAEARRRRRPGLEEDCVLVGGPPPGRPAGGEARVDAPELPGYVARRFWTRIRRRRRRRVAGSGRRRRHPVRVVTVPGREARRRLGQLARHGPLVRAEPLELGPLARAEATEIGVETLQPHLVVRVVARVVPRARGEARVAPRQPLQLDAEPIQRRALPPQGLLEFRARGVALF